MRILSAIFFVLMTVAQGTQVASAESPEASSKSNSNSSSALCLKGDDVAWWEGTYCQVQSGADDWEADVFKECKTKFLADKSVPKARCKKINWLKMRTCEKWNLKPKEKINCLRSDKFKKEVEGNHEYYYGG